MKLSDKQRSALEFLRQTTSSDRTSRRMLDFASGTLSSLRKGGLIDRVKDAEGLTAYRLTALGLAELGLDPMAVDRALTAACSLCNGKGVHCNYHGGSDCGCASDCPCTYDRRAS